MNKQSNSTGLVQEASLRQHMSPQQVRFVRLLEMSGPEIEEAVHNELDENPALESVDETEGVAGTGEGDGNGYAETSEQMQAADYGDEDDTPAYLLGASGRSGEDFQSSLWEQHRDAPTLIESLNSQLDVTSADGRDIAIARYLVGYLDDNGRLSRRLTDIADDISIETGHTVTRAMLLPALDIIRYQLEPPGLGAVDLRECLLIQLRRRSPKTLAVRVAEEIVSDYFDLFTKKHYDRLCKTLGIDMETLEQAVETIRSLDPKPGSSFGGSHDDKTSHITPDFYVSAVDGEPGRFSVSLNQHIPELAVEQTFLTDGRDPEASAFIRRKREEANTFIGLIKRRNETLMTVIKAIVKIQKAFFETEDRARIRTMRLTDIEEMTGLDKSVISRATSNKYVATPAGIYPLKLFFNDSPTADSDTSSQEILAELEKVIASEDKKHPYSDRELTDILNARGYDLARRTVTKYREKNHIPVARLRREYR